MQVLNKLIANKKRIYNFDETADCHPLHLAVIGTEGGKYSCYLQVKYRLLCCWRMIMYSRHALVNSRAKQKKAIKRENRHLIPPVIWHSNSRHWNFIDLFSPAKSECCSLLLILTIKKNIRGGIVVQNNLPDIYLLF